LEQRGSDELVRSSMSTLANCHSSRYEIVYNPLSTARQADTKVSIGSLVL
jgi:hypothetical protein